MPEKVLVPLSLLRPLQSVSRNNAQLIADLRSQPLVQQEALETVWLPQRGYFAILDGHHRFTAAWLNSYRSLWCSVVGLEYCLAVVPGMRKMLAEVDRRIEEYEVMYCTFLYQQVVPPAMRQLLLPGVLEYVTTKGNYETF